MTMPASTLGRLEQVDLRDIWTTEAGDFTPWLAGEENLRLLGDAIGMELEFEAQEKDVGPFRADILCKDTETDHWVLVENQLERTDHGHLGQLLTYAAGLKAVTIVWIAHRFTEEHRAALDWLNEITDDRFNFFGLEIELWRIGNSPVAPKFNVVCKPNDWSRAIAKEKKRVEERGLTEGQRLQLEFWTAFRKHLLQHHTSLKPRKPYSRSWMGLALGRSGFSLRAVASFDNPVDVDCGSHEIRAEVVIQKVSPKQYFALLKENKKEIERELSASLTWYNPEDKKKCRIYLHHPVDNLNDREKWPEWHAWLGEKLDSLHKVFGPRVRNLDLAEHAAEQTVEAI